MGGTTCPGLFAAPSGRRFCDTTRTRMMRPRTLCSAGYTRGITGLPKGGTMSAQGDIAQARDMRAMAKTVRDAVAKHKFEEAALRLEKRAAKGASRVARRKRKKAAVRVAR